MKENIDFYLRAYECVLEITYNKKLEQSTTPTLCLEPPQY